MAPPPTHPTAGDWLTYRLTVCNAAQTCWEQLCAKGQGASTVCAVTGLDAEATFSVPAVAVRGTIESEASTPAVQITTPAHG